MKLTIADKRSSEVISGSYIKGLGSHLKEGLPSAFPANLGFGAEVIIKQKLYFTSAIHDTAEKALEVLNNWTKKYLS